MYFKTSSDWYPQGERKKADGQELLKWKQMS